MFSTEITKTDGIGSFWLSVFSLESSLLLSAFVRGYKDSPSIESYSLASLTVYSGLQSTEQQSFLVLCQVLSAIIKHINVFTKACDDVSKFYGNDVSQTLRCYNSIARYN